MMLECPHCFRRVGPDGRGICPSCQRNVYDWTGVEADRAAVWIGLLDHTPAHCLECGDVTERRIPVARHFAHETGQSQQRSEPVLILLLTFLVSIPLFVVTAAGYVVWTLILGREWTGERTVTSAKLRVPQCESCKGKEPRIVEEHPERLKFVVHRKFKAAFEAENAKRLAQ